MLKTLVRISLPLTYDTSTLNSSNYFLEAKTGLKVLIKEANSDLQVILLIYFKKLN